MKVYESDHIYQRGAIIAPRLLCVERKNGDLRLYRGARWWGWARYVFRWRGLVGVPCWRAGGWSRGPVPGPRRGVIRGRYVALLGCLVGVCMGVYFVSLVLPVGSSQNDTLRGWGAEMDPKILVWFPPAPMWVVGLLGQSNPCERVDR